MGHFEIRYDSDNVSGIHIMTYHVRINLMKDYIHHTYSQSEYIHKLRPYFSCIKGHWTSSTPSPNFFQKKGGIFIPLEVLAWVMTACRVLRSRLTYF